MSIYKSISLIFIMLLVAPEYSKNYYDNGVLKSEGWLINEKKEKYWYFYHQNAKLKAKGHFENDIKEDYWYYYNKKGNITQQGAYKYGLKSGWWKIFHADTIEVVKYKDSKKEGLAVFRLNGKPVKAEYYKNNLKTHTWYSLKEFKKEYPDL